MSILTTITNRLTTYTTNFQNNKLNHQPNIDEGTTVTENAYGLFDLFLYYLMNLILFMVLFIDLIVEFINNCVHNYNIVACSFKHKLYNNIN